MGSTKHIKVDLDVLGHGTLHVDDRDLTNDTVGVDIHARAGQITQVAIYPMPAAVLFDGDAEVVVVHQEADPAAIAAWIGRVDPAILERAALGRQDLTNEPHGLVAAMLRTLVEWASGKDPDAS